MTVKKSFQIYESQKKKYFRLYKLRKQGTARFQKTLKRINTSFDKRLFWGAENWIFQDITTFGWNRFKDAYLISCSKDARMMLRRPKDFVDEDLEDDLIRETFEIAPDEPSFLSFDRFFHQAFPYSNKKNLLRQPYPWYLRKLLKFFDNTLVAEYRNRRLVRNLERLFVRGEYNIQVRTTNIYPDFEFPEQIKDQASGSVLRFNQHNDFDFDLIYYSMSFLGQKVHHNLIHLRQLWRVFLSFYNLRNRAILRNEWRLFNLPYKEVFRRFHQFSTISRNVFYIETYFAIYALVYFSWNRYLRTVFVFYYNYWLVLCRSGFLVLLTLHWILEQQAEGEYDWDHRETNLPVDYSLEEFFDPTEQTYVHTVALHNDEIAGQELLDLEDNEARYALFEPEKILQSDLIETPREKGFGFADSEDVESDDIYIQTHWWQQTFGQSWWLWGYFRKVLMEPLNKEWFLIRFFGIVRPVKPNLTSYPWLALWFEQLVVFGQNLRFYIEASITGLTYFKFIIKPIRTDLIIPCEKNIEKEEDFPLINYARPWEVVAPLDGREAFLPVHRPPRAFRRLKKYMWKHTAFLLIRFSQKA
jgi:hypothetical protein